MKRILVPLAIVAIAGVVVGAMFFGRQPGREYKMSDGSILRVEKVSFGKQEAFKPEGGWVQAIKTNLAARLPASMAKWIRKPPVSSGPGWSYTAPSHPTADALNVWVTRRDATNGDPVDVGMGLAALEDEHGCVLWMTVGGGDPKSQPSATMGGWMLSSIVNWYRFEAFPRRQGTFRLRVYGGQNPVLAEFTIVNPGPKPPRMKHPPKPPPVTVTDGEMTFTLAGVSFKTNYDARQTGRVNLGPVAGIVPKFEVKERGEPTQEWQPVDTNLWDNLGNFATRMRAGNLDQLFLCPDVEAWRLVVSFCGVEQSRTASNATWTIRGVDVPAPGTITPLQGSTNLHGVTVKVQSLSGAGETTYSNGVAESASVIYKGSAGNAYNSMSSGPSGNFLKVETTTTHLAVMVDDMKESQRLSVRARDDQGRDVFASVWQSGRPDASEASARFLALAPNSWAVYIGSRRPLILLLDLAKDAKTVDLTFCLHEVKTVEFNFKPPPLGGK